MSQAQQHEPLIPSPAGAQPPASHTNPPPAPAAGPGCGGYLLLAAAGVWVAGSSAAIHLTAWFVEQLALIFGAEMPSLVWLPISWGHALMVALPVALLAGLGSHPRMRATALAWGLGIIFVLIAGLARAFPLTWNQAAAAAQIVLSLLFVLAAGLALRRRLGRGALTDSRPPALGALALALALVPLLAAPLLVWGALGSLLDTFLNALSGVVFGLAASLLLAVLFRRLPGDAGWRPFDLLMGAFSAGVLLMLLGSGYGAGGSQLLLMVILPPLGLAAAGLAGLARRAERAAWPALAALVGLTTAAALMLIDPDELMLILGGNEILAWAMRAAWLSLFLSILAGGLTLAAAMVGGRAARAPARRAGADLGLAVAALSWLIGLAVYLLAGQPGLYGERLFVVMRQQADLTQAPAIADREARLAFAYTTLVEHALSTQAGLHTVFDRLGVAYQPYYLMNAIEVNGGPLLRVYLELHPDVDRVLDSPRLRPLPQPPPLGVGNESAPASPRWNITSIGADRVWSEFGVTGQGIIIGQSDSGVELDHPALAAVYRGRGEGHDYNWFDPWNGTQSPVDIGGHGTHTLGSIVGQGGIGVAPGAEWFGCSNLARNLANPALYLDCMQFMLAPFPLDGDPLRDGDPARAAHVINNSWGCPPLEGCDPASLEPAVIALRAAGIFVVASAGNEGPGCGSVRSPLALYDSAFSVGAVDSSGNLADFSSRGPVTADGSGRTKPDISAPGHGVLSALPGGTYGTNSGTSMAGPHVAGAVALMWAANPALIGDIERTEQILRETAQPFRGLAAESEEACAAGPLPNNAVGHGLLDAYAAVERALSEE